MGKESSEDAIVYRLAWSVFLSISGIAIKVLTISLVLKRMSRGLGVYG